MGIFVGLCVRGMPIGLADGNEVTADVGMSGWTVVCTAVGRYVGAHVGDRSKQAS